MFIMPRGREFSALYGRAQDYGRRGIDHTATAADASLKLIVGCRALLLSLLFTAIFGLPGLISHSRNTAYLYTGDVLGFYWPFLAKAHDLISHLHLVAIDFSLFNGSGEFFLASNVYGAQPFFVLYSLLTRHAHLSMEDYGYALVWLITGHMFIFCYSSVKLLSTYLDLTFPAAVFGAVFCAFGIGTVADLGEPEFLFTTSALPWTIYAALDFERRGTLLSLPAAAAPVVFLLLGGYLPLGIACLFLATAFIAVHIVYLRAPLPGTRDRLLSLARAAIPIACGLLVIGPYLLAVFLFFKQSPSATTPSLFFSAHQLSEAPSAILRILSQSLSVPGAFYEFSVQWGFVALAIALLFVVISATPTLLTAEQWRTLKFCGVVYAATVLAIYGPYSAVSDMVFLFVPQVGTMHIYQRFLYPASLLLAIALAIMLQAMSRVHEARAFRIAAVSGIILTLALAWGLAFYPHQTASLKLNNSILFELILMSMFLLAMTVPGQEFKIGVALVLICLPQLNVMYNWSRDENRHDQKTAEQPLLLDADYRGRVAAFMRDRSRKDIIKYADLTPMWRATPIENFPKSFPYLVLDQVKLSSYGGFNFYLSPRADYMRRMPVAAPVHQVPDWAWLRATHADFVVAETADLPRLKLAGYIDESAGASMPLPNGMVLASLKFAEQSGQASTVFDNGYFHVGPAIAEGQPADQRTDLALNRPAQQSGTFGGATPDRAVDGNLDGDFAKGSVSHTDADPDAWWQVDLGTSQTIGEIVLWNRTDCCTSRLSNAWVFVSNTPFGRDDTAATLQQRPGTWSRLLFGVASRLELQTDGIEGRFVRIQFDGSDKSRDPYLSLAEVQVFPETPAAAVSSETSANPSQVTEFWTNSANRFRMHVNAAQPLDIAYQFWAYPGLRYRLDGRSIQPRDVDGLKVIRVEPGEHDLDIRLINIPLTVFWAFFFLFWLTFLSTLVVRMWIEGRSAWIGLRTAIVHRRE